MARTWGAAGTIRAEHPMTDSDFIVEVLKSIGGPGSVWQEITDTEFSATFNVYAENAGEAAPLIREAIAKAEKGLGRYGAKVDGLSEARHVFISRPS